jgi:hypothetical protein
VVKRSEVTANRSETRVHFKKRSFHRRFHSYRIPDTIQINDTRVRIYGSFQFFFCGEVPRSRRTATLRLIVQPCDEEDQFFFFVVPSNGAPVEWNWQGKTEVPGAKPGPVPLCPPQIPHVPRVTLWAMLEPIEDIGKKGLDFIQYSVFTSEYSSSLTRITETWVPTAWTFQPSEILIRIQDYDTLIWPVILYGRTTWPLTPKWEAFESEVFKISKSKEEEARGIN